MTCAVDTTAEQQVHCTKHQLQLENTPNKSHNKNNIMQSRAVIDVCCYLINIETSNLGSIF